MKLINKNIEEVVGNILNVYNSESLFEDNKCILL